MEWYNVKDSLPNSNYGKYRIKRSDNTEMDAFYYADKISWIALYGQKTSHWWDSNSPHERLDDVTHWTPIRRIESE